MDQPAPGAVVEVGCRATAEEQLTAGGLAKTDDELRERGLACAGLPDDCDGGAVGH